MRPSITIGMTGGSGALYGMRLLQVVQSHYEQINVVISAAGRQVLREELDLVAPDDGLWNLGEDYRPFEGGTDLGEIRVWRTNNYNAPFASGSNCAEQMVVVPCSMSTVASLAHGIDQNLLHHAAAVSIKERKDLIIVPRETPLSTIHLRNLTTLAELGVAVVAAMPGFYSGQKTMDDLVNFVVQKILNQLRLGVTISRKWGSESDGVKESR